MKFVRFIFGKTVKVQLEPSQEVLSLNKELDMIDWNNKESKISKYFTVKEATYLPSWDCYHTPSEDEKKEIIKLAEKMDIIRERLGKPIKVHVWIRPKSVNCPNHERHGQDYNLFIGSKSTQSGHIFGQAIDFSVKGETDFKALRQKMIPWLEELKIRMEDIEGNWIHIDTKPVGSARFFKP
jgi:hypothetical protein